MKNPPVAEMQSDYVVRAQNGDKRAVDALLAFCERDIQAMVKKVRCSAADREDLAQVGRLAVLKAIPKFDPTAGKQFRFYAADWAREDIRRSANVNSSLVVRNVHTMSTDVHIDAPIASDEDGEHTVLDSMESDAPTPEEAAMADDDARRLREVLERIITNLQRNASERYDKLGLCRSVVFERLLSEDPLPLDVIAERFQVARETVRKLEVVIRGKLADEVEEVL